VVHDSRFWIRSLFCIAAAFIGFAVADPIVESLSNAGAFGPGNYTDRSLIDVLPAMLVGATAAAAWLVIYVRRAFGWRVADPKWILQPAVAVDARFVTRALPAILCTQIVILFALETAEQFAVYGHVLGPLVWLGAPVAISLAAHAFASCVVTLALLRVLRNGARAILAAVVFVARSVAHRLPDGPVPQSRRQPALRPLSLTLLARRTGERAPPFSA